MEIFRKGSDPPPLFFGSFGTLDKQKGEKPYFSKTLKMAIFNLNLLGKFDSTEPASSKY